MSESVTTHTSFFLPFFLPFHHCRDIIIKRKMKIDENNVQDYIGGFLLEMKERQTKGDTNTSFTGKLMNW